MAPKCSLSAALAFFVHSRPILVELRALAAYCAPDINTRQAKYTLEALAWDAMSFCTSSKRAFFLPALL
jgi:hypothetical protein